LKKENSGLRILEEKTGYEKEGEWKSEEIQKF
jgi:hypothetical protein